MQCKYCGAKLSENAKFCGVCGNKVERETVKPKHNDSIPDKVHNILFCMFIRQEHICSEKGSELQKGINENLEYDI